MERGEEVLAIVKTREGLRSDVGSALKARYSYETPIIVFLGPFDGDPDTLAWLAASTGS